MTTDCFVWGRGVSSGVFLAEPCQHVSVTCCERQWQLRAQSWLQLSQYNSWEQTDVHCQRSIFWTSVKMSFNLPLCEEQQECGGDVSDGCEPIGAPYWTNTSASFLAAQKQQTVPLSHFLRHTLTLGYASVCLNISLAVCGVLAVEVLVISRTEWLSQEQLSLRNIVVGWNGLEQHMTHCCERTAVKHKTSTES